MIGLVNLFRTVTGPSAHVMMDVSEVLPTIYIGTNQCCRMHYKLALLDRGVAHDISLEGEEVDQPYGVDSYLWLPTPDHAAPSDDHLRLGVAHLDMVITQGGKAYVHCKNGHGRAPTLVAAWLMSQGRTPEEAMALIKEKRPETHFEPSQAEALRRFVAKK
jgi:hypothetical protein